MSYAYASHEPVRSSSRHTGLSRSLRIGEPHDEYEQEADRVADAITSGTDTKLAWSLSKVSPTSSPLRRKCSCGESSGGAGECEECKKKETLQRRATAVAAPSFAPPIVHEVLNSSGRPLDQATRNFFEPRFRHDFSRVRVHSDRRAAESAGAVNAQAYTVGSNVVFGAGQYDGGARRGIGLLAHELAHVVQQGGGANSGVLRRAAIHSGRILDEGTCSFLVKNSKFICCDPDNGVERKGKKKDIDGTDCPSEKFTPIFTCDSKCDAALKKGCSDADDWMALPKSSFTRKKCGQDLVICANGNFTHAHVRDHSDKEVYEVSRAIPTGLGVNPDFSGAIYPDENDADFKKDKRCHTAATKAAPAPPSGSPAPQSAGPTGGTKSEEK